MNIDRLVTFVIFVSGILLYLLVIPAQTESVDYGFIVPKTIPNLAVLVMTVAAGVQLFIKTKKVEVDGATIASAVFFFVLVTTATYAMSYLGFLLVAPLLAFAVMMIIGERRWPWLLLGAGVLPVAIWFIVERLLGRTLP